MSRGSIADVIDPETARFRMGEAFVDFDSPGGIVRSEPSWWMLLTPLNAADANMALVHRHDPAALDEVTSRIAEYRIPALLLLAGDAEPMGADLGAEWSHVGAMPIMSRPLAGVGGRPEGPRAERRRD